MVIVDYEFSIKKCQTSYYFTHFLKCLTMSNTPFEGVTGFAIKTPLILGRPHCE